MVGAYRAQPCIQTDQNKISLDPCHVVPFGASKTISKPMVRSAQTVHPSCVRISTISNTDRNELLVVPGNLGVPSGASKTIFEPMVRSAQTVH
jgi:hypothetical protein